MKSFAKRISEKTAEIMAKGGKGKKGQSMNTLVGAAIGFGVLVLVVAVIALILGNFQATQTVDTLPYNVSGDGLSGLSQMSGQFTTIAIIVVAVFIIGLVVAGLYGFMRNR